MLPSIPETMQVVASAQPGGPEVLATATRPVPAPGDGEILIRVAAAGVNRPDVMQRKGLYPAPRGASDLLGLEVSGTVAAVGTGVVQWKPGDAVCALTPGGGYAEYCLTHATHCLPVPRGLDLTQAASLPETFFTVWSNVWDRAELGPGETLLVQGGTSGIGVAAIQLAAALGHRVFATAGSDEKCRRCIELGAEHAVNYRTEDFVEIVKTRTNGKGVDVVLDMVAGDYLAREMKVLADDGRIVIIASIGGAKSTIIVPELFMRRLTITGSTLRPRSVEFKANIAHALREHVWPLFESGRIKPVVFRTFPLARAADAHALMESGEHIGKIMLTIT